MEEAAIQLRALNAFVHAQRDLENAEIKLEAAQSRLSSAQAELNRIESYVCRAGVAPRYVVAYDEMLRKTVHAEKAAANAVTQAQAELHSSRVRVTRAHAAALESSNRFGHKRPPAICSICCREIKLTRKHPDARICDCGTLNDDPQQFESVTEIG